MKIATSIALLSLGSSVSAALGVVSSNKCWRKCARQVGVSCGWSEVTCNCRAVNAGLYAAANQCYCNMCSDDSSKLSYDWTSVQLNAFSVACAVAFEPIDQQAIDKAVGAASCDASGNGPSNNIYTFPDIYSPEEDDPPPPKKPPRPKGPKDGGPPPKGPSPAPLDYNSVFVYSLSPTDSIGASTIVVPIASTAPRDVTYSYATLTVPVTPVPVSTTTVSGTGQSTNTKTAGSTSTKTAQKSRATAVRKDAGSLDLGVSVFALAAAVIFGL